MSALDLAQEDAERDLTGQKGPHGTVYPLSRVRFFENGYSGCGNGFIVVHKETDQVIEMSYASDGKTIVSDQNIAMCRDAGRVLGEDEKTITYRANFSCWTACLF